MRLQLNIIRAGEASAPATATEPAPATLAQLLEQAANKARIARDIADGIENVEEVTMSDIVDISTLCSEAIRLINDAKKQATATDPQPPTPALALAPQTETALAA